MRFDMVEENMEGEGSSEDGNFTFQKASPTIIEIPLPEEAPHQEAASQRPLDRVIEAKDAVEVAAKAVKPSAAQNDSEEASDQDDLGTAEEEDELLEAAKERVSSRFAAWLED